MQEDVLIHGIKDKQGQEREIKTVDCLAAKWSDKMGLELALVNKEPEKSCKIQIKYFSQSGRVTRYYISGDSTDDYNDCCIKRSFFVSIP